MPQRFKVYEPMRPHFITTTVLYSIPVFSREDRFMVLADSLNHCIANRGLHVHSYVIMPDHFHMVGSQEDGDLSGVIRDIKRFTSHQLTEMLNRDGRHTWLRAMQRAAEGGAQAKLWDDAFHPEQVHTEGFCKQKIDYLHNNPVAAGYVWHPSHWKYSSAGLYLNGTESVVRVEPIEW